jgi:hypothetical protein
MHWQWGDKAGDERDAFLSSFSDDLLDVVLEMQAHIDFLCKNGEHPSERDLPSRRSLRAIATVTSDKHVLFLIFTVLGGEFVAVLAAAVAIDEPTGGHVKSTHPVLPDEAWDMAQARLDSGKW